MQNGIKNCKYTRTLLAGLAFGIIYFLVGGFVWGFLFGEETEKYANLWRDMNGEDRFPCIMMGIGSLLIGLATACAYCKFYKGICGEGIKKGLFFGLKLWFIVGLGEGVHWFGVYPVSATLLGAFMLHKFLAFTVGGIVIAYIFGNLPETCGESCSIEKVSKKKKK